MILFYDNGGATWDRYTMYVRATESGETVYHVYGFSTNALEPDGFNQYSCDIQEVHDDGDLVNFDELPLAVQQAVIARLS